VTDSVCCLVKIIEKDEKIIAAVQFKIKLFDFFTSLNSSLIIFVWTYTVNYRNALDRLRVHFHMNIILLFVCFVFLLSTSSVSDFLSLQKVSFSVLRVK